MVLENTHANSNISNFTLRDANHQIWRLASSPCIFIKTANNTPIECIISGTYYHPLLIPHIACWVSADYALLAKLSLVYLLYN